MNQGTAQPDATHEAASILGRALRDRRKAVRVSVTAAALAAEVSRVTWHRMEAGEPTVAFGSWLRAAWVLGGRLEFNLADAPTMSLAEVLPLRIHLSEYPQLQRLGWQLQRDVVLSPKEAFGIYERNWRHVDEDALQPHERSLIDALRRVFASTIDSASE